MENLTNPESETPIITPVEAVTTPKKKLSLEMIFSSLSLIISILTFVITAIQTQIMQNQQKASAWAYLEAEPNISSQGFAYQVQNKGVGAAIIKKVSYSCDGKKYNDFIDLAKDVVKDSTFNYDYYSTHPIHKKVFAAGEKIQVFYVKEMKYAEKFVRHDIIVEIDYADIYGEVFSYVSK